MLHYGWARHPRPLERCVLSPLWLGLEFVKVGGWWTGRSRSACWLSFWWLLSIGLFCACLPCCQVAPGLWTVFHVVPRSTGSPGGHAVWRWSTCVAPPSLCPLLPFTGLLELFRAGRVLHLFFASWRWSWCRSHVCITVAT